MSDLFNILERAYKKLKASIYFDKTQLVLRNRIVMYEGDDCEKFKEKLHRLAVKLTASESEWTEFENELLKTIEVLAFPKKVKDDSNENLIRNDYSDSVEIERAQYFFDMDVEGQLLGVLWILYFGIDIDENLYKNSYGNRLKPRVKKEKLEVDENLTFSPYLFKPYYNQYETWRDIGLKLAQDYLNKGQDILIITMDFKDFYHSVDFSEKEFKNFYNDYCEKHGGHDTDTGFELEKRINMFVFRCIEKYSKKFKKGRIFLPIGFLPSNILSNWYLDKFDKEIINKWNPVYYGRYVDDIIIVEKIEKNSPVISLLKQDSNDDKDRKDRILEYYLCNCKNNIGNDCKNNMSLLKILPTEKNKQGKKEDVIYEVNKKIFSDKLNPKITLQNNKVKVFYFNYKESDALITCFRNTIRENKSEFRFLPEDGAVFYDDDYSEIYDVKNSETINKFRGIEGIIVDKFALSKFLGKYLRIGSLITDKKESKFVKDINKIFDSKTITENYFVWEKVLQFFIENNKIDSFIKFVQTIKGVINKINFSEEISETECSISDTLSDFLFSAVVRSLSLCWGKKIKKEVVEVVAIFEDTYSAKYINKCRKNYCCTRMIDKHLMPLLIDTVIEDEIFLDDKYYNLCFLDTYRLASDLMLEKAKYKYYPYMITPQDISLCLTFGKVMSNSLVENSELIDKMKRKYVDMNYKHNTIINDELSFLSTLESKTFLKCTDKAHIIKVGDKKKQQLKIAVTSAAVSNDDFVGVLTDKVNRSFSRYNKLSKIINQAIKHKADILVLPEAYVPYEWIPLIARKCANAGMAIITGIEHIKSQKSIYNITATILPYNVEEYTFSYIGFHTKVHYSPEEERQIKGYGFEAKRGDMYDLFLWNDLWFSTYCCYELASIRDRCIFSSYVDMLAMVECNKDVNYYSNIIESLSRDMHCYCVQVNSSEYGDSRITQPAKTEIKDIIKTKGGTNETILIGEIDINKLRNFQIKGYELQKDDNTFKPTPPQLDIEVVKKKIKGVLFSEFDDD
ncbi:reverse transcriptase domain-containing protein [Acetivibrio cellulolyticus]|uniref:reverse transcriptase domain-containing protein n=1 Tax=Acetivibrio cellulolyticus TaxID=35830 RepID=UPI0001E2BE15|nr:reverse transcriptase domain-containing protein [Acetivibrio cellulolyticus]